MAFKESARILSLRPSLAPPCCITSCSCIGPQPPRAHHGRDTWSPKRDALSSEQKHSSVRCYASVSGPPHGQPSSSFSAAGRYTWPTSPHPTPYEVLAHPRGTRYNKALFYELVKIYHPDKAVSDADSSISSAVRLDRYRMVVAANEILSDAAKRRAYDLYGTGWNGNRTLQSVYREADRSWRNEPGNASRNATWEDWERWRHERNGEKPPPTTVFMSNELFAIVLCSFVILGSLTQARRAKTTTMDVVEMRDQKHAAISDGMVRRQNEQAPLGKHERVENFLRRRDSWDAVSSSTQSPQPPSAVPD
ncbi:hypothetical protein F4808DRAFT_147891 [Astrocystis sublimbata]|nr:hypothetical protein F4808DRAFT_147891 [Astrocystis sublimbata]